MSVETTLNKSFFELALGNSSRLFQLTLLDGNTFVLSSQRGISLCLSTTDYYLVAQVVGPAKPSTHITSFHGIKSSVLSLEVA